jgi:hypothetical protein
MILDARYFKVFFIQILIASFPFYPASEVNELQSLLDQVSIDRINNHIEDLVNFRTRYALSENCNESAQFLFNYFSSLDGFYVTFHNFSIGIRDPQFSKNIVALKKGTDRNNEYILLFAHYDSISNIPLSSAPGANDNACGVAIMMEIASIINKYSSNRRLIFIAFSGEELGLLGSRAWVNDNDEILGDTIAGICLDGVGRGEKISIIFADEESTILADLVFNMSIKLGFENFEKINDYRGLTGTDSGAFFGRGVRVIRLWDKDRTYIHTIKDLPETLYPSHLVDTTKVILASLFYLLNKPFEILFEKTYSEYSKKNEIDQINKWIIIGVILLISLFLTFYKKRTSYSKCIQKERNHPFRKF